MQGKLAGPVWGWGPGAIPGPTPLFCGSDGGGRAAAIFFSLIVSCKRHHIDPFAYLHDILIRLPAILSTSTPEELTAWLPHRWQTP